MLGAMLAANTSLVSICLGDDALGDAVSVHPCQRSFKFKFFLFCDPESNNDAHVLKECMVAIINLPLGIAQSMHGFRCRASKSL